MTKHFLTILLFLVLSYSLSEAGQKVAAVQSIRVRPYEEAVKGFESVCKSEIQRFVLSELKGVDAVKWVLKSRPDVIVAVGFDALSEVRRIKNIPIVYLMVLNPQTILAGEKNITGVRMNIPQEKQLALLSKALPGIRNIGLVYDPEKTNHLVKKAREAAGRMGIKLTANEAHSARDVPSRIKDMKGRIDVFWMLPDVTVITPETTEFLILFCLDNKIPILTFSEQYLKIGAMISIGIDAFDLGCQAGEKANNILSGNDSVEVREIEPRKINMSINHNIAGKLGIIVDEDIISEAKIID